MAEPLPVGIHTIDAERYHADPCAEPSLSASIATLMCNRSPRHAWTAHPRLNPAFERTEEAKFDVGTTAHALLLNGVDVCRVINAADWRTNAAKEARDQARAEGLIPMLVGQWERVRDMVAHVRVQLEELDAAPPLLTDGKPEQTLVWQDEGVACRARLDWLRDDHAAIDDLKTTGRSADPADWTRRLLWDIGADVQAAFYMRGLKALTGVDAPFRWVVVENTPPYAVSVISLAPSALAHANEKVEWALAKWRECLATDAWPAYSPQVAYAELSPFEEARWTEARWLDREETPA
jgi:hypothetical protein